MTETTETQEPNFAELSMVEHGIQYRVRITHAAFGGWWGQVFNADGWRVWTNERPYKRRQNVIDRCHAEALADAERRNAG